MLGAGDRNGYGRRQAAAGAPAVDDLANGAEVYGFIFEGLDERLLQLGRTHHVEQLKQPGSRAPHVFAALGHGSEEGMAARRSTGQPIRASVLAGIALTVQESLQVLRLLNLQTPIPRALMGGDHFSTICDANPLMICEDDQSALGPIVRNGVVVEIEANIGRLANLNLEALVGGERIDQRQLFLQVDDN